MSNELIKQDDAVEEIKTLHNELLGAMKRTLELAYRIGELLYYKKLSLSHGEFIPWINENMPFTVRTGQNYIKIYENKKQLEENNILFLSQAFKFLKNNKCETVSYLPVPESDESEDDYIEGEIIELTEDDLSEKDKEIERLKAELEELKAVKKSSKKEIEQLQKENTSYKNLLGEIKSLKEVIIKVKEIDSDKDADQSIYEIGQTGVYVNKCRDFFIKYVSGIEDLPINNLTIKAVSKDVAKLLRSMDRWGVRVAKKFKVKLNNEGEGHEYNDVE